MLSSIFGGSVFGGCRRAASVSLTLLLAAGGARALERKDSASYLDQKEFFKPELSISSSQEPIDEIVGRLPNRAAWEGYLSGQALEPSDRPQAYVDPRSGAVTSLMGAFPLLPGRGVGNHISLTGLSARIGRHVDRVDAAVVSEAVATFAADHSALLGIDLRQLGAASAVEVTPELWQVRIPQRFRGIPVRHGHLVASINNGNLVVIGTETWGDVRNLDVVPKLSAKEAVAAGYGRIGGALGVDKMVRQPELEILPAAVGEPGEAQVGSGYKHLLVWTFTFRRAPDDSTWEVIVDAHGGEVLAFQDINQYLTQQATGGVYPIASTEICPTPGTCGVMQSGWPMPFADTGLDAPNDFTNSAGLFDWTGGPTTLTLTGRYVDIVDSCGAVLTSSTTGSIGLGGTNGQHDCSTATPANGTTVNGGAGNTPASRTAFYEINRIAEMARGWLPNNAWLQSRVTTNVNLNKTCNAFWNGTTLNFYRSGGGCRNTGEIAGVFDHEWGHGLDENDSGGEASSSSEAYADIAAIYRLQASCIGHGFYWTSNKGCGQTGDGTGYNIDEAMTGGAYCATNCSGVRDADWVKHSPSAPATALGFVCSQCTTGSGPCGKQAHCAAAPSRQAAWDFAARDLQSAPFNLDSQTAFLVANRIFYQGSGSIGSWHACACGASSSGCGATNAYMQWLTADDDNGNLLDGTPHMTALFNAFHRHGMACSTPAPVNRGCATGPKAAVTLSVKPGSNQVFLSWSPVAGAARYWVFRAEGHAGCNFGKTRIAEVAGTTYTDDEVANGRAYFYNVVAAGTSEACSGPVGNCAAVTPAARPAR